MTRPTADSIKREFSRERLVQLAIEEGLRRCGKEHRLTPCPSCHADSDRVVKVDDDPAGYAVWACQRCRAGGSAVDLVATIRGLELVDAVEVLAERLHLLPDPKPSTAKPPPDVAALWRSLATEDATGLAYLDGRGLGGAAAKGLVRFNVGRSGNRWLDARARDGFRVAMPLYSVTGGAPASFQLRFTRPNEELPLKPDGKPWGNKLGLAGLKYPPGGLVFGEPAKARTAPLIYVAEGIADTLALLLAGVVVLGAPGQEQLRHLPDHLGDAAGRTVILCPQNDKPRPPAQPGQAEPPPTSQQCFAKLADDLEACGFKVHQLHTPALHADPAEWRRAVGPEAFRAGVAAAVPPKSDPQLELPVIPARPKKLIKSYASLLTILRHDRRVLPGALAWDEMLWSPTLDGRELEDADTGKIRERVELLYSAGKRSLQFAPGDIDRAVEQLASDRRHHPVREYLAGLTWDGTPRLDLVAGDVLGVADPLARVLLRKWFISAVARALSPGCKVDTVLILQGDQGLGKSSFFEVLAGQWFSDKRIDIEDDDSLLIMQRAWILEWAELATMKRAQVEELKAFITKRDNEFRPPYGRRPVKRPRHTVIVGTTNPKEFLTDTTGNRRFWPIAVTRIDLILLRAWRDKLWAEAVAAFRGGEAWHLTVVEEEQLRAAQREYEEAHPWEALVFNWLTENARMEFPQQVTTENVLQYAVGKPKGQWTRGDQMAVAAILKRHGWIRPESRSPDASGHRARVWLPPDPNALPAPVSGRPTSQPQPNLFPEVGQRKSPEVAGV